MQSDTTKAQRVSPYVPPEVVGKVKIAIVGEAPGEEELLRNEPFVGSAGRELTRMLRDAGIVRNDCFITLVFPEMPENGDINTFCVSKKEAEDAYIVERPKLVAEYPSYGWPEKYIWPQHSQGKYFHPRLLRELPRLRDELLASGANLILALGNTATWALCGSAGISKLRGSVQQAYLIPEIKCLPTYHPAHVIRAWDLRVVGVADFLKASREQNFPEIIRPQREVWIEPTFADMEEFYEKYLLTAAEISIDVETEKKQITCIGFSAGPHLAITIPFWDKRKPGWNYWATEEEEIAAWKWVEKICQLPQKKIFQNGVYDLQYIWRAHGIKVFNASEDTMLMHHSMYTEMEKGLGFLGSIYTNESSWKVLRTRGAKEEKKDA